MSLIDEIREKIGRRLYEFSTHAVDQSIVRDISVAELEAAIAGGSEVIEDYPGDKYGPSCLILCCTKSGRPLIKIITLYQPDPDRWIDFRIRK